jgi:hypothetical protein
MVVNVNKYLAVGSNVHIQYSRHKPTCVNELKAFYGIHMAVESTYGNSTRNGRKHFKSLKQQYKSKWPKMGWDCYSVLSR